MSIDRDIAAKLPQWKISESATDELKSCFLHLWIALAHQTPQFLQIDELQDSLNRLAKLTPANTFSDEFIHLNLSSEAH